MEEAEASCMHAAGKIVSSIEQHPSLHACVGNGIYTYGTRYRRSLGHLNGALSWHA